MTGGEHDLPPVSVPNLTSPSVVAELMRSHGLSFRRSLGQNFLIDRNILEKLVGAADLDGDDCAMEIGAGIGTVTCALAPRCRRVLAIEIDRSLLPILESHAAAMGNVTVVPGDALKMDLASLMKDSCCSQKPRPWKVVSNLPYYITSPLITSVLFSGAPVSRIVLMIQREVAARITASPGSGDYGAFSVACQYKTRPRVYSTVPRTAFMPAPEVDSAIIVLDVRDSGDYDVPDEEMFFKVVREAFNQRRKTISAALRDAFGKDRVRRALLSAGIAPDRRGETLSIYEFAAVSRGLGAEPGAEFAKGTCEC